MPVCGGFSPSVWGVTCSHPLTPLRQQARRMRLCARRMPVMRALVGRRVRRALLAIVTASLLAALSSALIGSPFAWGSPWGVARDRGASDGVDGGDADAAWGDCGTVHVAMVCAGLNTTRGVAAVLKSVLAHRRQPLALHLIVDDDGEFVLRRLLDSWAVPGLTYEFIAIDVYRPLVSWIPSVHYSGVYGLVKLTLEAMLPRVDRLVALDTDVLFTRNIGELWAYFGRFGARHAIAMVENQSTWYFGKMRVRDPWPAIGRGFNTGVMLLRLERLRAVRWRRLWQTVGGRVLEERRAIGKHPFTDLADQDVVNAVLKRNADLVLRLPCEWNLQLSKNGSFGECLDELRAAPVKRSVGVVHWSSKLKTGQILPGAESFAGMLREVEALDSAVIRAPLPANCASLGDSRGARHGQDAPAWPASFPEALRERCISFRVSALKERRLHPMYNGCDRRGRYSEGDATLVLHSEFTRLKGVIEHYLTLWDGPISVAVSAMDEDSTELLQVAANLPSNICVHVMYEDLSDPQTYPETRLKKFALSMVATHYALILDGTSYPPSGATLRSVADVASRFISQRSSRSVVVVPTFTCESECTAFTREDLADAVRSGRLSLPHESADDYSRFMTGDTTNYGVLLAKSYAAAAVVGLPLPSVDEVLLEGVGFSQQNLLRSLVDSNFDVFVGASAFITSVRSRRDVALGECFAPFRRVKE